ncbi:uncharacterized protein OCT59_016247 [Rhizophagus irregularis]|uniref:uncharacterized protein n=1 Tax=Rhizophagus irregularis TaxID=588596 RepID=UPI0033222D20|nr:hypothetical protein OCT59_016247 [Rhizophagus irregularis]
MVVNRDVQNANHRLKHALNLLIHRCRETYEERDILKAERDRSRKERDELQDELEVQTGLLGLTQDELNNVQDTITSLEANLAELEREFGGMRTTNRRLQQQYNLMRGERNRAIGERYINTVGIDPLDDAGAPPGRVRAMGVLRSCMRDEAASRRSGCGSRYRSPTSDSRPRSTYLGLNGPGIPIYPPQSGTTSGTNIYTK